MKAEKKMEVLLVAGFLGAGKTTLIKHFLTSNMENLGKVALIVNEAGQIGIDGTLLSGQNVDLLEITSGCICCTLKGDFSRAIQEIFERAAPDFLVVEATGIALPGDILDALYDPPANQFTRLRYLVTVVDADFFKAREALGPFYERQIESADALCLNKVDLVSSDYLREVKSSLQELNPEAAVFETSFCQLDPGRLLDAGTGVERRHHPVGDHHNHDEGHGFNAFSFEDERPLDRKKMNAFLDSLPPNLFRLKGWVRFPDSSALLSFTAGRYGFMPEEELRPTALSFVGYNCDEEEVLKGLRDCFIP